MEALVGAFNKEKALVGAFPGHHETSRRFVVSYTCSRGPSARTACPPCPGTPCRPRSGCPPAGCCASCGPGAATPSSSSRSLGTFSLLTFSISFSSRVWTAPLPLAMPESCLLQTMRTGGALPRMFLLVRRKWRYSATSRTCQSEVSTRSRDQLPPSDWSRTCLVTVPLSTTNTTPRAELLKVSTTWGSLMLQLQCKVCSCIVVGCFMLLSFFCNDLPDP